MRAENGQSCSSWLQYAAPYYLSMSDERRPAPSRWRQFPFLDLKSPLHLHSSQAADVRQTYFRQPRYPQRSETRFERNSTSRRDEDCYEISISIRCVCSPRLVSCGDLGWTVGTMNSAKIGICGTKFWKGLSALSLSLYLAVMPLFDASRSLEVVAQLC